MSLLFFSAAPLGRETRTRRLALGLSLVAHVAANALLFAWGNAPWPTDPDAVVASSAGFVRVSLMDGAPAGSPRGETVHAPEPRSATRPAPASAPPVRDPSVAPVESPEESLPTAPLDAASAEGGGTAGVSAGTGEGTLPGGGTGGSGSGAGDDRGDAGSGLVYRPPRLLVGALPLAPDAITEGTPPTITARLLVGVDGRVSRVDPTTADLPPAVLQALLTSAHAMRFMPARRGADAVPAWFPMTFTYHR